MVESPVAKRGLVVGIGNVLRRDDGLGPQTAALVDEIGFDGRDVSTLTLPQIDITLANSLASVDFVVFVDARIQDSDDEITTVHCEPTKDDAHLSHTSHALSIPSLIAITRELYGKAPNCYMVLPKGYDFAIGEQLSPRAEANRQLAAQQIIHLIETMT